MDSPFNKLFGTQLNYSKLRVFGSLCFPWLRPYRAHKLEDSSTPCFFLGYSPTQSAYLCLQPQTGRIYVSRHVHFDESIFPFKTTPQTKQPTLDLPPPSPNTSPPVTIIPTSTQTKTATPPNPIQPLVHQTGIPSSAPSLPGQVNSSSTLLSSTNDDSIRAEQSPGSHHYVPATSDTSAASTSSPSQAQKSPTPPSSSTPVPAPPQNKHPMVTRRKNQINKPNSKYNCSAAISSVLPAEPNTLAQALKDKRWRGSMSSEIDAFARNGTYYLVPHKPDHNVVSCRRLYKNNFNSDGSHRCCKCRLVAKGYNQQYGRDYTENFQSCHQGHYSATCTRYCCKLFMAYPAARRQ